MKKIPETFIKNEYEYTLIKRVGDIALYHQFQDNLSEGCVNAYEIHKVRERALCTSNYTNPDGSIRSVSYPDMEILAGNKDFGKYAWSIKDKEYALQVFDEKVKEEEKNGKEY